MTEQTAATEFTSYTIAARGKVFRVFSLGVQDGKERYQLSGSGQEFIATVWEDGTVTTMNVRTMDSMRVKGSYVRLEIENGRLVVLPR